MQDGEHKVREPAKNIDFSRLLPCGQIIGDDTLDTALLNEHRAYAEKWITSFHWCNSVKECFFGCGLGGIIAIFLMRIEPASQDIDEYLWIVVGDVPPAYLVTDHTPTPAQALETYCDLMQSWVDTVRAGKSVSDCIPVNAAPTPENADALEKRLTTLQQLEVDERPELLEAETIGVRYPI